MARAGIGRFIWWDRSLWWRTYTEGGFDGYRTLTGRRLPCDTLRRAVERPELAEWTRRLARPKRWHHPRPPCSM